MGVGDLFRGNLRTIGVLVVESPLPQNSRLEGCCFFVGSSGSERPCIFANAYKSTWFRRNTVLLHELGHAVFEGASEAVSIDLAGQERSTLQEVRAQAFAEEFLLPPEFLRHLTQARSVEWNSLQKSDLAYLMASSHAEQSLVLSVAKRAGLISAEQFEQYGALDVWADLRLISEHALSAGEYIAKHQLSPKDILASARTTTVPKRSMRLPVKYVLDVLEAVKADRISDGKAAEMLMIDKRDLHARFPELVELAPRD